MAGCAYRAHMAGFSVRRLVVPLDGTPQANASLPLATGLAQALRVPVLLARAVALDAEREGAEQHLQGIAHELGRNTVAATIRTPLGAPAAAVLSLAQEGDLLILGLTGRADFGQLTRHVLEQTQTPVILRRAGGRRVMRPRYIGLVAQTSRQVVPTVADRLRVLTVVQALATALGIPVEPAMVGFGLKPLVDVLAIDRSAAWIALDPSCDVPVLAV